MPRKTVKSRKVFLPRGGAGVKVKGWWRKRRNVVVAISMPLAAIRGKFSRG